MSGYEPVQINLLKMLINYIKNCIQQNRSFGNFYYKLKQNDYQQLVNQIMQLSPAVIPAYFGFIGIMFY